MIPIFGGIPTATTHYRADDGSELTIHPDGSAVYTTTTQRAGFRVPVDVLAGLAATADDTAAAQVDRMLAVAGEAAAATLAEVSR